jgi:hypothetical protein
MTDITRLKINECIAARNKKVAADTTNMLITALRHRYALAKKAGYFRRELSTEGLKYLTLRREKRALVSDDEISRICTEATCFQANPLDEYILRREPPRSLELTTKENIDKEPIRNQNRRKSVESICRRTIERRFPMAERTFSRIILPWATRRAGSLRARGSRICQKTGCARFAALASRISLNSRSVLH